MVTARGEDVLVLEAVLRAGDPIQRFLLHQSLDGGQARSAPGARVSVLTPAGVEITFQEDSARACITLGEPGDTAPPTAEVRGSCYVSPPELGTWVVPGGEYELRLQAADGRRLRGRTTVPGGFAFTSPTGLSRGPADVPFCTSPPDSILRLVWTAAPGAWVYLAVVEIFGLPQALAGLGIRDIPEPLRLSGVSISAADTVLVFPTQFGVFERGELDQDLLRALQNGLPPSTRAEIVIAAVDRNLVNAVRGGAFNPSGNVRISSVVGDGVGVFGSLVPLRLDVHIAADDSAQRCRGISG